jgi:phage virion morphogenesis protein
MQDAIIYGLDDVQDTLKDTQNKLDNTKPLMLELANHLNNIVLDSFESHSSPDGIEWSPIKSATYKKLKGGDKLLYASGKMQDSQYMDADHNSAEVGFNAVSNGFAYPLTHQFGTNKAGRNRNITIEARPFMPIHKDGRLYYDVEDELQEMVWEYLEFIE